MIKSNFFRALMVTLVLSLGSAFALNALSAYIIGPTNVPVYETQYWSCNVIGGGPYWANTYAWYWKYDYDYTEWHYAGSTYNITFTPDLYDSGTLHFKCEVSYGGASTTAYLDVEVYGEYAAPVVQENEINNSSFDVNIAPNPASEFINVSINNLDIINNSNVEIRIINTAGQIVLNNKSFENATKIDISSLPNGLYNLQVIVDGKQNVTKNIIKF